MKTKRTRNIILLVGGLLGLCICSVIAVALFGDTDDTGEPPVALIEDTAVPATPIPEPTEPEFLARCEDVPEERVEDIQDGVDDVAANNYVVDAYAVRSEDYGEVYFMAAYIYGDGMEDGVGPGVWARVGGLEEPGLILSVGGFANEFSTWGDGGTTDAQFSLFSDGVQEAIECAEYFK